MSTKALAYLRNIEWSMGNGQCPECHGARASWYGHPCHRDPEGIGHRATCELAAAISALGEAPLMVGTFRPSPELVEAAKEPNAGSIGWLCPHAALIEENAK